MEKMIDINEGLWEEDILKALLIDNTTKQNIIWATEDYEYLGKQYASHKPIKFNLITGKNSNIIQPRAVKSSENQLARTKKRAEVYTPSWMCNEQNNLIDTAWFGRENVFNISKQGKWKSTVEKIVFPQERGRTWKDYVDEKRLEITCGEAPYLVSRYDTVTGKYIKPSQRIGQLDRKMRVVSESVNRKKEWIKWAERAVQSIYGFDFQGDSLLLARENLLASYVDYYEEFNGESPSSRELLKIAKIIAWNIWQMDGLTYAVPYAEDIAEDYGQLSFFSMKDKKNKYSMIKDWQNNKVIEFRSLV